MDFKGARFVSVALLCLVMIGASMIVSMAYAEEWKPTKTVRLIVTDSPGTPYDGEARMIATEMTKIFDRPVIVENMVGGGMMMGAMAVYQAKSDGYTIAFTSSASLIMNQIFQGAKYDVTKFTYIGQCSNTSHLPLPVSATKGKGVDTWEAIRKLDRPFRWGTVGKGTITYVAAKALSHVSDFKDPVYISSYSGTDLMPAVARGEIDGCVLVFDLAEQFIKAGDVNLVLVTGNKRLPQYPDVPCFVDIGHPELQELLANHHIVIGPPGLPEKISRVLGDAALKASSSESMKGYQKRAVYKGIAFEPASGDQTRKNVMGSLELFQKMAPYLK